MRVAIIIPIRNPGSFAARQIASLMLQTPPVDQILIIDSGSGDGSADAYRAANCELLSIPVAEFDHGGTRNLGLMRTDSDVVVFLTQDAILQGPHAISQLCRPFSDPGVGIVYGRQLPRVGAGAIERHARLFNYTTRSQRRHWPDDRHLGFRAVFNSNAFAAYRRNALDDIGGFPERVIFGEDQVAAGRALLAGWTVVYASEAAVEHSHGYSLLAEFHRYFDIGVCAKVNRLLFDQFGGPGGEGRRFVLSELSHLLRHAPHRIPEAGLRTAFKLLGYRLGKHEMGLPPYARRYLAMNTMFYMRGPQRQPTGDV